MLGDHVPGGGLLKPIPQRWRPVRGQGTEVPGVLSAVTAACPRESKSVPWRQSTGYSFLTEGAQVSCQETVSVRATLATDLGSWWR